MDSPVIWWLEIYETTLLLKPNIAEKMSLFHILLVLCTNAQPIKDPAIGLLQMII
jgi:hypothetical protein